MLPQCGVGSQPWGSPCPTPHQHHLTWKSCFREKRDLRSSGPCELYSFSGRRGEMCCEWLTAEPGLPNAPSFLGKPRILTYPDPCAITPALPWLWDTLAGSSCCSTTTYFSPHTFLFSALFFCPAMTQISPLVSCAEPKQEHRQEVELLLTIPPRAQPCHGSSIPSSPRAWEKPQDGDRKANSVTQVARGQDCHWAGDYVLMGLVPAGRSQHGAAGAWEAAKPHGDTKAIGSQHFPHAKTELAMHPNLFGSGLEL